MNSKDNISEGFKDLLGGINKELNNSAKATDNDTNKIDNTHQNISDPEKDTKNDIESSSETNGGTRVFDAVKKESTPVTTENSSNNLENSVSDKKRVDKPTEKNTENPVHPLHNRSLPKKTSVKTLGTREHLPAENKEGGNKMTPTKSSSSKKTKGNVKKGQRRGCLSGFLKFIVYISFVAVVSVLLGFYLISVGNDMFAFVKDTYDFSETVCSVKGDANNSFKITRTKLSGNKFTFDYKFDTPLSEDEKKSVDASIVLIDTKDNSVTMNYGKFSDFIRENKSISVDLSEANMTGSTYINKLNLTVRAGEIVGLAGVSGNGQRELAEALTGLRVIESGEVTLDGVSLVGKTPKQIIAQGMGYVPEERNIEGIVPSMTIRENLVLKDIARAPFSMSGVLINNKKIDENADAMREKFDIRCSSVNVAAGSLSGGNIQKVILAREISRGPKFLIAVYPIRGLDLGAAEFIHKQLLALRDSGVGILLISEELEEVINLSDRIAVIFKGQIQRTLGHGEATQRKLGMMMAGVKEI